MGKCKHAISHPAKVTLRNTYMNCVMASAAALMSTTEFPAVVTVLLVVLAAQVDPGE